LSSTHELAELHDLIGRLRRCVTSLKSGYGDTLAMRRVANDAERIFNDVELLDIDAAEFDLAGATVQLTDEQRPDERVAISATHYDYDAAFWRDVDNGGAGRHSRP
jgi:hypothetical protein